MTPSTAQPNPWGPRDAILLIPLLLAVVFVQSFSGPLPLTDEWSYTHAIREMEAIDWGSRAGWAQALDHYPTRHSEHLVGAPFLIYWPLAEWTHFDSRWAIYLTVAAFAIQVLIFRRRLTGSAWAALPVAVVVLGPAHYMEFLWGWQSTLSFSVALPLIGLAVLARLPEMSERRRWAGRLGLGLGAITLGHFSSAGGFFGFPAAVGLIALLDLANRDKAVAIATIVAVGGLLYWQTIRLGPGELTLGAREFWYVLTAMGAALWGSPVGLTEFQFDARSAGGLAIAVCLAVVVGRAIAVRTLPRLALALAMVAFGVLCVVPIAMSRPYLGNWHVQYALPVIGGAYAAAWLLWRQDRSLWSAIPFWGLAALLASGTIGTWRAFTDYGPVYRDYIRSIEDYTLRHLEEPDLTPPYPPQGATRDMDTNLTLFLAAHDHPLFAREPAPGNLRPLPAGSQVFLDESPRNLPLVLPDRPPQPVLLTVTIPTGTGARGILARAGETTLTLRPVAATHAPTAARLVGSDCFMALLVPHLLPSGVSEWDLNLFE